MFSTQKRGLSQTEIEQSNPWKAQSSPQNVSETACFCLPRRAALQACPLHVLFLSLWNKQMAYRGWLCSVSAVARSKWSGCHSSQVLALTLDTDYVLKGMLTPPGSHPSACEANTLLGQPREG